MKVARNFERTVRRYIEGFFNKKFSSGLEPIEIAKNIVEEMEYKKFVGISKIYVPNTFRVRMNNADFEKIKPYGDAVLEELKKYILESVIKRNYTFVGDLSIDLSGTEELGLGELRVASDFSEPIVDTVQHDEDTRIFTKIAAYSIGEHPSFETARLIVKEGPNAGCAVDIVSNRVNIGRRESNELPLTDPNTSRLHAYIVAEEGGHILYDAKSLNGTYVNDNRIIKRKLKTKDRIKVGNTVIVYEVT